MANPQPSLFEMGVLFNGEIDLNKISKIKVNGVDISEGYFINANGSKTQFYPRKKTLTYNANKNNVNLRTDYNSAYPNDELSAGVTLEVVINSGVIIGSTSTSNAALTIPNFGGSASINIINNGTICGKGGDGGDGGGYNSTYKSGGDGSNGGTAIAVQRKVNIVNNGTIGGGGGGGGGTPGWFFYWKANGESSQGHQRGLGNGGGGGAGIVKSKAGSGGTGLTVPHHGGTDGQDNDNPLVPVGQETKTVTNALFEVKVDGKDLSNTNPIIMRGGRGGKLGENGEDGVISKFGAYTNKHGEREYGYNRGWANGNNTSEPNKNGKGGRAGYAIEGWRYVTYSGIRYLGGKSNN